MTTERMDMTWFAEHKLGGLQFGQVGGLAVDDSTQHLYIFHRCTPAATCYESQIFSGLPVVGALIHSLTMTAVYTKIPYKRIPWL